MYNNELINKQFSLSPDYQGHFAQKLDEGIPDGKSRFCLFALTVKELEVQFTSCEDLRCDIVLEQQNNRTIYLSFSSNGGWRF